MEYSKDLLAIEKKSIARIVLGILFLIFSGFWVISKISENIEIRAVDWAYSIVFVMNGVYHTFEGYGYSFNQLFGKAYVLINNELISIKPKINKKEKTVYWKDIKLIDFQYNQLIIEKADNTNLSIDIINLEYDTKKDIRAIISQISENKNIKYITQ